jgi:outer membrane lipoprotein carrier protein
VICDTDGARHIVVTRIAPLFAALPLLAADSGLSKLLDEVERHYNGVRTLQVSFDETITGPGRPRRTESGELYLRKPGKMRWDYRTPAGKLFISNGKDVFYYSPASNRAEKLKLRETEDMRAPLAFLLGRLDFEKDFTNFSFKNGGDQTVITASPRSDKLPYKQIEFSVSPQREIRRLVVTGHDAALLTFHFSSERMNPPLDDKLFRFELPKGAQWVDSGPEK